ncbi:MAG: inositol monophosphatase [Chloroflexi bacterium]|nr:inositol monophosphatase [Chloroflexota bacterium]
MLDATLLARIGDAAARYAAEGGRMALAGYPLRGVVEFKDEAQTNPVTELDRAIERALCAAIASDFPDHSVLGEEGQPSGPAESEIVWAVDPLDGTRNFVNGLPLFAVSVGALWRGRPVAGALFCTVGLRPEPAILHARLGGGAWLSETPLETPLRAVAPALPMSARLVGVPAPLWRRLRPSDDLRYADTRSLGSVALELALVASGALQAAIFGRPKVWDLAAGLLLVQEAGGAVLWRPPHMRRWRAFEGFGDGRRPATRPDELRKWACPVIAGSAPAVAAMAARLPGPELWQRLWTALARRVRRGGRPPRDRSAR